MAGQTVFQLGSEQNTVATILSLAPSSLEDFLGSLQRAIAGPEEQYWPRAGASPDRAAEPRETRPHKAAEKSLTPACWPSVYRAPR